MKLDEARAALEKFIVDNDDLLDVESHIGRFNIFDALRIDRVEIRHSNFLAFIMDPAESHGQGQLFLKAILMDVLKNAPPHVRPISPIDLDGLDLRGVDVRREWKHIDILVVCEQPRFVTAIENKVGSREGPTQLARYRQTVESTFRNVDALFVYLTPDLHGPSQDDWVPYDYRSVHRVLSRVRNANSRSIGDDLLAFLDHYLSLLGTRFMTDDKLDKLCRRIYKNHRQALDLIWERVGSPESAPLQDVNDLFLEDERWHVLYKSNKYVDVIPSSWMKWLPPFDADENYPACLHIRIKNGRLGYVFFIGPMKDSMKRKEIVTKLREEVEGIGLRRSAASDVGENWARITAITTIHDLGDDDDYDARATQAAMRSFMDDMLPRLEKLGAVLQLMFKTT